MKMCRDKLYLDGDGKTVMRPSYCLFMDVLGFSDEMKDAYAEGRGEALFNDFSSFISSLVHQMDRERRGMIFETDKEEELENRFVGWVQKVFTDNIVIGLPIQSSNTENEFGHILMSVIGFQLQFALHGYFVRGGLDFGDLAMDDSLVFGLPILEAHRLECSVAKYPRIVFSDTVNKLVDRHLRYYSSNLERDFPNHAPQYDGVLMSEGLRFFNYMSDLVVDGEVCTLVDWDNLALHKRLIEERLSKFAVNARVHPKYQWLASYHNAFCDGIARHWDYKNDYKVAAPTTHLITGLDGNPWSRSIYADF